MSHAYKNSHAGPRFSAVRLDCGDHFPLVVQQDSGSISENAKSKDQDDNIDEHPTKLVLANKNSNSRSTFQLESSGDCDIFEEARSHSSFHSAKQNGFHLSQYELNNPQGSCPSKLLSAAESHTKSEKSQMLPVSSCFQVSWHNVAYKTKLKISLSSFFLGLVRAFKESLFPNFKLNNRTGFYTVNGPIDSAYDVESKTIIENIHGSFKSGELTAVMGPSGAGKTSLLNLLSLRRDEGYTGQVCLDSVGQGRIRISTIPQNDYLPEYLTVRENLMYASRLKNDDPSCDHDESIKKVSSILGLNHCLDTKTRIISGGELKRLAIAQELLSKPDILILDEPTSGLDSLTCYKTISVLKNITLASAKGLIEPIAIVLTIHQPQQEVFDVFDKIYVLANGGIAIYNGPPDACTQFIEQHAGVQRPDEDYNTASLLIDIASGEYGPEPIDTLARQVKLGFLNEHEHLTGHKPLTGTDQIRTGSYRERKSGLIYGDILELDIESLSKIEPEMVAHPKLPLYIDQRLAKGSSMNTGSFCKKTAILSQRYWISILRDPKQLIARIVFHIVLPINQALITGTEAGGVNACPKFTSQYALKDLINDDSIISSTVIDELDFSMQNAATLCNLVTSIVVVNAAITTLSFTMDLVMSLKEHHNGWYSMTSYITARLITDLPFALILPAISIALALPLTGQLIASGLPGLNVILICSLANALCVMAGQMVGMIIGAFYMGHVVTALFASQGALLPFMLIGSFMVRPKHMSRLLYALTYTSLFKHAIDITFIARYGFNACQCESQSISGQEVKLVGVSERLKSFTQFWLNSADGDDDDDEKNATASIRVEPATDDDIFQLFAKQISLYNTHGIEVKSCADVQPYQLAEASLNDDDIARSFVWLLILLVSLALLLMLTVKHVTRSRSSL